jgi:uncharacterized protein YbjT (DUF2867 family)
MMTVLVVGATGSVGRLVVDEAIRLGHAVRALARDPKKARQVVPAQAQVFIGDVTRPDTLGGAVTGVDAIVFTLGSDGLGEAGAEAVNYGGVWNVLNASLSTLASPTVRIALMTAIGVTARTGLFSWSTEVHDWKRRSERLVRASGLPYTIVRPGWFDKNGPDQQRLVLLQGDRRQAGDPGDGVIARRQIAQVLVASLNSDHARCKSFELVAEAGAASDDLDELFAALDRDDAKGDFDGVHDLANMPADEEPQWIRGDLKAIRSHLSGSS